ncbi:unnamed protein product [Meganyctiphanes norvegica]|uniref:Fibronectin type-III domain-containing protein n=1 Tax=Meganyctiphanes norvegica TaxID=48144 RepID=A0AAV2QU49_MEGNR
MQCIGGFQLSSLLSLFMVLLANTVKGLVLEASTLKLILTRETADGVLLTWMTNAPKVVLHSCTLYYSPLTDTLHVQTEVSPSEEHVSLRHLSVNVTYYAYINCLTVQQSAISSNTVNFTPHGGSEEINMKPEVIESSSLKSSTTTTVVQPMSNQERDQAYPQEEHIVVMMSQRHMESTRYDYPLKSRPSTSVILGAVCGVVGFVIINVTVVLLVRKISNRRARQRRLQELQLQQHGGYIYNLDELLQNYNNHVNMFGPEVPWDKLKVCDLPQDIGGKMDAGVCAPEIDYNNT